MNILKHGRVVVSNCFIVQASGYAIEGGNIEGLKQWLCDKYGPSCPNPNFRCYDCTVYGAPAVFQLGQPAREADRDDWAGGGPAR